MTPVIKLDLPQVTLCAVTSVNVAATVSALQRCMQSIRYAKVLLFTDDRVTPIPVGMDRVQIARLGSTRDYSLFLLRDLGQWIKTSYCLVVQWDGFVLNADRWNPRFLDYDYIGAPWPQFDDGHDVGNGGFSLRSRRLLEACLDPDFHDDGQAEDLVIARTNRTLLEQRYAIRYADKSVATRFSHERSLTHFRSCVRRQAWVGETFGFHGVFNMIRALGPEAFAEVFRSLDHKATVDTDLWSIVRQLLWTRRGRRLALEVLQSWLGAKLRSSRARDELG